MLKILQARLQQYVNHELPEFKLDLEKAEEPEIKCQYPLDQEKAQEFQQTFTSALSITPKPLTVWTTTNYGKFLKRWEYQTT